MLGNAALSGESPRHFARVFTRIAVRKLHAHTPISATEFVADAEAINHEFGMTNGSATAAAVSDERGTRWRLHWRARSTLGEPPLQQCNIGSQRRVFADHGMQAHAKVAGQSNQHANHHGCHGSPPFSQVGHRTAFSTASRTAAA